MDPLLPERLPEDPFPLVERWIAEASARVRNATAMTLATVEADGRPSARMVICRGISPDPGFFAFYTDRESAKGCALDADPRAALVFHWDALQRQIRVEGPVTRAPEADSDAYWATRPHESRLSACASAQTSPLASRAALIERLERETQRFAERDEIPRPARWGGFRVFAQRIELWAGQPDRLHDRAAFERELANEADGFRGGAWRATRLQP